MLHAVAAGPALLERREELARIESALERAKENRGSFLVVEGPPGIGKTALLAAAREAAAADGMLVLRSRGAELEREFAFGVVRQLFEPRVAQASFDEREDLLQGPAGVAASVLGMPGAHRAGAAIAEGPHPSFAVLHGLYWLCANFAARRAVCLAVDDAHWADSPSLRFLAFMLPRLEDLPIALIVATRPRESGADAGLLAALSTDSSAELLRLGPLTSDGVAEFVAAGLGADPDAEFVSACCRATRGTPFLLRELVAALRADEVAPTAAAAGRVERIGARTVGRSILLRLDRLPEAAGRLARGLSILERGELWQAARLAELEEGEAAKAADVLAAADVVESARPLTFVHPIVRTGIYAELTAGQRARGHRMAALLLAGQPGATARVAEHLLVTEPAADAWVVEVLVAAANAAARSGAPESASAFLRRALEEPPAASERPAMLLALGMAEASAGLTTWPVHLEAALSTAVDDSSRVAAAMVLALALGRANKSAMAVEVLDRAASLLDPAHDELAMRLEAAAVGVALIDVETAPTIVARRDALVGRAAEAGPAPPELLAVAAFAAVLSNRPVAIPRAFAQRALIAGEAALAGRSDRPWYAHATWFSQTTVTLIWTECYEQVVPLLDASVAAARATGDSGRFAVGLVHRAWVAFRRGNLVAAEADTRTALDAAELPAPTFYRLLNAGILIDLLAERGALDEAEEVLTPLEGEATAGSLTAIGLRLARGRLRVAQGRPRDGLAAFC